MILSIILGGGFDDAHGFPFSVEEAEHEGEGEDADVGGDEGPGDVETIAGTPGVFDGEVAGQDHDEPT